MGDRFFAQRFRLIGRFPGEMSFGAAEMAERRGRAVDRPAQLQMIDDALRREREVRADELQVIFSSGITPVPKVLTMTETGSATPMA